MSRLKIEWIWTLKGQFHVGAGIGRVGYADAILRHDGIGNFFIPGDAVKGAVRESAERLLYWLIPTRDRSLPATSFPDHPVLEAIFAPAPGRAFYRFSPGIQSGAASMRFASTAIQNDTGVADDTTLRTMETLPPGTRFQPSIAAEGIKWTANSKDDDRMVLCFLLAALCAAESIGGKKGVGHGEVGIDTLSCRVDGIDILTELLPETTWTEDTIKALKKFMTDKTKEGGRP